MINHHTSSDPSPELVEHVTGNFNDFVDAMSEGTETEPEVILKMITEAAKARLSVRVPSPKPEGPEDAVEREIRRSEGIKWSATCAVVALDESTDGSIEEYEDGLAKVIATLMTKLSLSIQGRLLQKDITASVAKLDA